MRKKAWFLIIVLLAALLVVPRSLAATSMQSETSDAEVSLKEDIGHEEVNGDYYKKLAIVHKPTVFTFDGMVNQGRVELKNTHAASQRQFISVNDDRRVGGNDNNTKDNHLGASWKLTGQLGPIKEIETGQILQSKLIVKPGEKYVYDIGEPEVLSEGGFKYKPEPVPEILDPNGEIKEGHPLNKHYGLRKSFSLDADGGEVIFLEKVTSGTNGVISNQRERGVFTNLGVNSLIINDGRSAESGFYTGKITWSLYSQP